MITNTNIEILAVAEVNRYFSWSSNMVPFIGTSTTFPVWDGDLIVYEPNCHNNSNKYLDRIIRVQVKGHMNKDDEVFSSTIKFEVPIADIDHYRRNGGVAYFVVCFNGKTQESRIYHSLLTPEQLKTYLREAKGKEKTNIQFQTIPENTNDYYWNCISFLNDCDWQGPYQGDDLTPIKIISKEISFRVSGPGTSLDDVLKFNTGRKIHLYNTIAVGNRQIHIPTGLEGEVRDVRCKKCVIINGTTWFERIKMLEMPTYLLYSIGDILSLAIDKQSKELLSVHLFNGTPFLSTILETKDFVNSLLCYKRLKIDEHEYDIDFSASSKDIEQLLLEAQLLKDILDNEGLKKDIRLSNLYVGRNNENAICLICTIDGKKYSITYPGINWSSLMQAT